MKKIAIQGQAGSFHDEVAQIMYSGDQIVPCDTFAEVFERMQTHQADHALVAIENSLYGSITEVYDLLLKHHFQITGEYVLHIHQQLIGLPRASLQTIEEIYSHPVAINQCRDWLESHLPTARIIEHHDTAGAVEYVANLGSPSVAAIAGAQAAQLYGLSILQRDIEDEKTNLTRFVAVDRTPISENDTNKASLVLTTSHEPGSLYRALGVFAKHDANLIKLQSRPIRGEVFKYQFFIDLTCDSSQLMEIRRDLISQQCQVIELGRYQAHS